TNGLDPHQIRESRSLIRELAQDCTVLISSHILPEIERTCDRVVMLAQGEARAQGALDELLSGAGRDRSAPVVLEARAPEGGRGERVGGRGGGVGRGEGGRGERVAGAGRGGSARVGPGGGGPGGGWGAADALRATLEHLAGVAGVQVTELADGWRRYRCEPGPV